MSAWPTKSLDEIFDIARGGSPRPIDKYITDDAHGVNWIMISDASASSKYIRTTKKRIIQAGVSSSRTVKPGDFLLTNSMSFGRPYILKTHGCIHDGWLVLSPKSNDVDSDYFYHLLGSPAIYGEFERLAAGATVKNLNIDLVKSVRVTLPSLDEQKRIAAILDQADELRRKRQRAIDRLNQLGQAIFHDMFGDSSKPGGWSCPTQDLRSVCDKVTDGTHQSPKWAESGIPFIFVSNVRNRKIDFETKKFVSEDEYKGLTKNAKIEAGDVLYTCVGSYGHTAVVNGETPFVFQRHIAHLKPLREAIDSTFLSWALETPALKRQADRTATGIAQKTVTLKALKSFEIPLPSIERQRIFARTMAELEAELAAMQLQFNA